VPVDFSANRANIDAAIPAPHLFRFSLEYGVTRYPNEADPLVTRWLTTMGLRNVHQCASLALISRSHFRLIVELLAADGGFVHESGLAHGEDSDGVFILGVGAHAGFQGHR